MIPVPAVAERNIKIVAENDCVVKLSDNFTTAPAKLSDNFTTAPAKLSDNFTTAPAKLSVISKIYRIFAAEK